MDKQQVEYKMVSEFISKTGASPNDALACLKTWGWDMKRALTDYNDTCTVDFIEDEEDNSKDSIVVNHPVVPSSLHKQEKQTPPLLTKQNSINLAECKKLYRGISRATDNVGIVSRARYEIAKDIYKSMRKNIENENNTSTTTSTTVATTTALTNTNTSSATTATSCSLSATTTNNFQYPVDTPDSTFILPNIYNYPDDFRIFIEKDLIEMSTLNALEQAQRLNWWVDMNTCRKLWPLATTGDGNCLLHAASLGMWGFHDRKLTLRTALYSVLSDGKFKDALHRRWRFQQTQLNKRAGFVYSESEWAKEWDDIISMASPEPRRSLNNHQHQQQQQHNNDNNRRKLTFLDRNSLTEADMVDNHHNTSSSSTSAAAIYESLEEIHILALAHVLRRTIIVISDTVLRDLHGEAMAPITFGGVYLPFEIEPKECNRGPLLLAYDMAHFSALVPMENGNDEYPPFLVPLIDYENVLLPIQFCIDPGENFDWKSYNGNEENWTLTEREHIALLKEYLDIVYVTTNRNSPEDEICEDITDDYDFEKKFIESEIVIPTTADFIPNIGEETNNNGNLNGNGNNKSKASRQLQSVAKQFGSIGKNMSRKLKKNIGSIAKLGVKNSQKKNSFLMCGTSAGTPQSSQSTSYMCSRILCARLRLKRHEYQEEMIRNYIECAQNRFYEIEKTKEQKMTTTATSSSLSSDKSGSGTTAVGSSSSPSSSSSLIPLGTTTVVNVIPKDENICNSNNRKLEALSINETNDNLITQTTPLTRSICINAGCNRLASSETSYLCPECFEQQKKQENLQYFNSSPRYGTGNSKFYTQADIHSHDSIRKLPSLRKLNDLDQTLYLSNSTFYNDVLPSYEEVERSNRESQRYPLTSTSHKLSSTSSSSSSHSPSSTTYGSYKQIPESPPPSFSSVINSSSIPSTTLTRTDVGTGNNEPSIPITKPCKTLGCPFYGNSSTNFLCSKCQKLPFNTTTTPATRNNQQQQQQQQQELTDYHNHHHHHHHHHHHPTFQTNPLYAGPTSVTLYKSESKITSDI